MKRIDESWVETDDGKLWLTFSIRKRLCQAADSTCDVAKEATYNAALEYVELLEAEREAIREAAAKDAAELERLRAAAAKAREELFRIAHGGTPDGRCADLVYALDGALEADS